MKNQAFTTVSVALAVSLFPALALAQAAVGYGMAASNSAGMASRGSSSATSRSRSVSRAVSGRLQLPPPPSKNLQTVMDENRQRLATESQKGGGRVQIESVPAKATIAVDGEPVGHSPAELLLPEGKHLIELTHPRFEPWRMEVMVSPRESTAVTAQLENKYRSSITLSIQ
jgi:hypothetical protein